jgi:hypothetical protein
VILDGTDGPMRITAQADTSFIPPGASAPPTRTGELCVRTPCIADLPVGRYKLYLSSADGAFTHGDTDELVVTEGVTYYLRAPGKYEPPTWVPVLPTLLATMAAAVVITGAALATSHEESTQTTGFVVMGAGAALGIWGGFELYDASRAKTQAGTTTTWKP